MITLALSKGRIFDDALPLLRAADIEVLDDPEKSRKLILDTNRADVRVLVVRATDVPTYVQYGGADLGITGLRHLARTWQRWPVPAARPADCPLPHQRGGARRFRLRVQRAPGLAADGGHQVHGHCARFLCRQGRACRPGQAVRQHGAGAADRPGRCHRRPGVDRQHLARQQPGRGGTDHGHQFTAGRQPGRTQAQAGADAPHHRRLRGGGPRPGGAAP